MESNQPQQNTYGAGPTHDGMFVADPKYHEDIKKLLKEQYTFDQLQQLVVLFQSADILNKHKGIIGIRKIISIEENPPIESILQSGIIPTLVEYLSKPQFPHLRLEAAWILTNVASGTSEQCQVLVDHGVISIFIGLLEQKEDGIIQQVIWGLGNIASDSTKHRNAIIQAGGVQGLIGITKRFSNQILIKHCAWALSNLCRGSPTPKAALVADVIPVLCRLIVQGRISDKIIIGDCCWAITYHSGQSEQIDVVINSGIVPFLLKLLTQKTFALLIPALRTLGNIATGTSQQTDVLLQHNIFPSLQMLLSFPKNAVVREACWMLSNIAAGTELQVDALLKCESLIKKLVSLFETGKKDVMKQICYVFINIGHNGNGIDVYNIYKDHKIIQCLTSHVLIGSDSETTSVALDCLLAIFISGEKYKAVPENPFVFQFKQIGGLSRLEALRNKAKPQIVNKVSNLLQSYFEGDYDKK